MSCICIFTVLWVKPNVLRREYELWQILNPIFGHSQNQACFVIQHRRKEKPGIPRLKEEKQLPKYTHLSIFYISWLQCRLLSPNTISMPTFSFRPERLLVVYFDQQMHACACIRMIKKDKKRFKIIYLLVNTILRNTLHLRMLYRQLLDQQAAPPTILNSGAKSPLTKAFVQLAPFLDQTNTIDM